MIHQVVDFWTNFSVSPEINQVVRITKLELNY